MDLTKYSNQSSVMFEVDSGELMYASAENPFAYDSDPIVFLDEQSATNFSRKFNTGIVVQLGASNNAQS